MLENIDIADNRYVEVISSSIIRPPHYKEIKGGESAYRGECSGKIYCTCGHYEPQVTDICTRCGADVSITKVTEHNGHIYGNKHDTFISRVGNGVLWTRKDERFADLKNNVLISSCVTELFISDTGNAEVMRYTDYGVEHYELGDVIVTMSHNDFKALLLAS